MKIVPLIAALSTSIGFGLFVYMVLHVFYVEGKNGNN